MGDSQGKSMTALIGAGALKATMADLPKGTIEHAVEGGVARRMAKKRVRDAFRMKKLVSSFKRRGIPRTIGGVGVGAATFPIFISGVKDLKSDDRKKKARGMAKVLASGVVYSGGKGGVEYALEKRLSGKKVKGAQIRKIFRKAFTARAVPGLAAAAVTAGAIGYGLKKKKKRGGKGSIAPLVAAVGGLTAAAKQIPETVYYKSKGSPLKLSTYRKVLSRPKLWVPRTVGRGVAGAFGAGILGAVTERVLRDVKK